MMQEVESTGRTIDEAILMAVAQLGVRRDDLDIEVLEEPVKGTLGLFGGKPARIRASVKGTRRMEMAMAAASPAPERAKANAKPDRAAKPASPAAPSPAKTAAKPSSPSEPSPARDFLLGICERMNLPATVSVTAEEGILYAEVSGPNMGFLIGHRGETLDALQYLLSLVVNKDSDEYIRVVLDTENYRKRREETLIRLAKRIADKVARSGKRFRLEPMNPYERRIIHYALQGDDRVTTASEGEEPYRRVVISLK